VLVGVVVVAAALVSPCDCESALRLPFPSAYSAINSEIEMKPLVIFYSITKYINNLTMVG
jgi:hypothetical protein